MDATWSARTADQDQEIARFLRAHPQFLAAHPELYRVLAPPARVHGEAMADHMAAMVRRERLHADSMTEHAAAVLAAGRACATVLARVHEAVLALMSAGDVGECLAGEVPRILAIDALCLCRYGDAQAGRLDSVLGARDLVFRVSPGDAAALYCEAAGLARRDVLIRLPEVGVLGLASRDGAGFEAGAGQAGLLFLGRAVAALLRRDGPAAGG